MRKSISFLAFFVFILALSSGIPFCQEGDISGTWVGSTEIPDQGTNELTMIIERAGDSYTVALSDSFGMVVDTECEEVEYEDNVLTFNFTIDDGYSTMTIYITLEVEGNNMTGEWETDEGDTGEITMVKKE